MRNLNKGFVKTSTISGNIVPVVCIIILAVLTPFSGLSAPYLVHSLLIRIGRNSLFVLALLFPIIAGMGFNFGIIAGALAGQIALIFIADLGIIGIPGILLAMIIGTPIAVAFGMICGYFMNRFKGYEMIVSFIFAYFFISYIYQFLIHCMGYIITSPDFASLGLRMTVNLNWIRSALDELIPVRIGSFSVPVATYLIIAAFCIFIVWLRRSRLGQDMQAVGQDMEVAESAGISVNRVRVIAIAISMVIACCGQMVYLQSYGTVNVYGSLSHPYTDTFAIAALLVGGGSVSRAGIGNALVGVILFYLLYTVAPAAGREQFGNTGIVGYFDSFITLSIILFSFVMHIRKRNKRLDANMLPLPGKTHRKS